MMQARRIARVRKPSRFSGGGSRFLVRFSFRNIVWLVLVFAFVGLSPQIYFHTKLLLPQGRRLNCEWVNRPPLVCAHGGDSSEAPPNTIAAYQSALNMQVECMEIDASRTGDGVLVALHDRDLQAIFGSNDIHVGDFNISQINELDAGARFPEKYHRQRVPTLEDALQFVAPHVKQVIIDAKVGPPKFEEGLAADVFSVMRKVGCSNCVMWAKADSVVQDLMQLTSDVGSMGYIVMKDKRTRRISNPLRIDGAGLVGAFHGVVTSKLVTMVHRAGKKVHAWTVDEESAMVRMLRAGVDGMITSVPALLQHVMSTERQQCALNGFS